VQVQFIEGEGQAELRGLVAVPVAPILPAADSKAYATDFVRPDDTVELERADQVVALVQAYAERDGSITILQALQPLLYVGLRARASRTGVIESQEFAIIAPAGNGPDIGVAQRSEAYPLTVQ
jgi:hypothetical protein